MCFFEWLWCVSISLSPGKKYNDHLSDIDYGGDYAIVRAENMWEICTFLSNLL